MGGKATIYKADVELADMDRHVYRDQSLTIARHPSETDERMIVRLLAFTLNIPVDDDHGPLEFAKDLWDPDEPCIWQKDLTGDIRHWIDVGQPDEKRLSRVTARVERMTVYSFASSTSVWWSGLVNKVSRMRNLTVWQIPSEQSEALEWLVERSMRLQVSVQDGAIWVTSGDRSLEVTLERLHGGVDAASLR